MKKKITNVISIILVTITVFMIAAVGISFLQMKNNRGIPTLGNISIFYVRSGSMEPTIMTGSGIIIEKIDDTMELRPREYDEQNNLIYEGDIITFFVHDDVVTHRLVEIRANTNQPELYGEYLYVTQGDCEGCARDNPIVRQDIIGRVVAITPLIGFIYRMASNRLMILFVVIIPLAVLTVFEGRDLLRTWKKRDEEEQTESKEETK